MTTATVYEQDIIPVNLQQLTVSALSELQSSVISSSSQYEQLADRKLKNSDVIVVAGYGCTIKVRNGALVVYPGKTYSDSTQEPRYLYPGVHGCKHIVLLTDKGLLSLDAIKWCKDNSVSITMIDNKGALLQSLSPEPLSNAKLRRAQYNANAGTVSCQIVQRKLEAQRDILEKHSELPLAKRAIQIFSDTLKWFYLPELPERYNDVGFLMTVEGRCANVYFEAFQDMPVKFEKDCAKRVPPHWKTVGNRTSPLSHNHGARHAVTVAQAILNYCYAVLESQVRQELVKAGFDLSCGFLHADKLYRDSLVYDLMELYRPMIDDLVLKFVQRNTFSKGDCLPEKDGTIKLNPELCRYIVASCKLNQSTIEEGVKWLRESLEK